MAQKILIVEDEKNLVKVLRYNLEKEGYRVVEAGDGQAGLDLFNKEKPDLVILDLMLPQVDGLEFCRMARRTTATPILILTAKKEEMDRVIGLEMGADDYVTKPFGVREVLARVKAILRRGVPLAAASSVIRAGVLEVDFDRYEVRRSGKSLALSPKEFEFLKHLIRADGRVLTRDQILEKVWGYDQSLEIDTNTVDQHIARLRAKLGAEAGRLVTVKNVGYRFKLD